MVRTHSLARNQTTNAALLWILLGVLTVTGILSALAGALHWGAFAVAAAAILGFPAALRRDWRVMVPWPLGLSVTVPVVARALGFPPEIAGYVAISALALAVAVELNAFTDVEMSRRLAVLFAAMTTMAFQSWWTIVQFYSDRWFGTGFVRTQAELQWDLVVVTLVSVVMGVAFLWYFDRIDHVGSAQRPVVPEENP